MKIDHKKTALLYLKYLEENSIDALLNLFSTDAIVHSPLYGSMPAGDFYKTLANDTTSSQLTYQEIFENSTGQQLALYFNYKWTLVSGKVVVFDVVDIIKFNDQGKVIDLKIIYDTQHSRSEVGKLK
ncbi:MAG: hypothetical protein P1U56_07990 [Saprospiraceae bacterium]|nr:hypothetical protein [Saprospiraceae bacterium]